MGCSNGTQVRRSELDRRLPFRHKYQVQEIQQFWEYVKRNFEETAVENMIRFFRLHPYFQQMFSQIKDLRGDQEMRLSRPFEAHALAVLSLFDYVIENMDKDVDGILLRLEEVARFHAKIEGFHADLFQYMEDTLVEAFRDKFWEKFTESHEELFRTVFRWIEECMKEEVEAIHYKLIPGD